MKQNILMNLRTINWLFYLENSRENATVYSRENGCRRRTLGRRQWAGQSMTSHASSSGRGVSSISSHSVVKNVMVSADMSRCEDAETRARTQLQVLA